MFGGNLRTFGREGSTLVPASAVRAPGESEQEHRTQELRAMAESQKIGAAVALRALGYRVPVKSPGTVVAGVDPEGPSAGKLRAHDMIVSVDGEPTPFLPDLRRAIGRHEPGETVQVTFRRGRETRTVEVRTVADPENSKRALIGILTSCALQAASKISLPVPVRIDLGQVGGPSAGLAFGLDVVEELGHDVDRGHKIAASGELCLDGTVVGVGGPQTEDDRCQTRRSRCLPRPGWGKRGRGAPLRGQHEGRACEEFSTGVARAGNTAGETGEIVNFRQFHSCRKLLGFPLQYPLQHSLTGL